MKVRFMINAMYAYKFRTKSFALSLILCKRLGTFCELNVVGVSFIQSKTMHLASEKSIQLLFSYLINDWCHHVTPQFECNWFSGEVERTEAGFCGGFTEQEHVGVTCMHSPWKYQEQETGIWNFGEKGI